MGILLDLDGKDVFSYESGTMTKVLVFNTVSKEFGEIDEHQLAHPWFSQFYKVARVNKEGKPYVPGMSKEATGTDEKADSKKADK